MVKSRIALLIVIILACLCLGYQVGRLNFDEIFASLPSEIEKATKNPEVTLPISNITVNEPVIATHATAVPPAAIDLELRLLLIGADTSNDAFSAKHGRLIATWLIIYHPSTPRLFWVVYYPVIDQMGESGQPLDSIYPWNTFDLEENLTPSEEYLQNLQTYYRLDWNGVLTFGKAGIAQAIDSLGGIALQGSPLTGEQAVRDMTLPWEDPLVALEDQVLLANAICQRRDQLAERGVDMSFFENVLLNHLRTKDNLDTYWPRVHALITQHGKLPCQFTLPGKLPLP